MGSGERTNLLYQKNSKHNIQKEKYRTNGNYIKKPNHIIQGKYPVPGVNLRQQGEHEKHIDRIRAKAKRALNTIKMVKKNFKKWRGDQKTQKKKN